MLQIQLSYSLSVAGLIIIILKLNLSGTQCTAYSQLCALMLSPCELRGYDTAFLTRDYAKKPKKLIKKLVQKCNILF